MSGNASTDLIDTQWNINENVVVERHGEELRFNRYIVEYKLPIIPSLSTIADGFNRYIVEYK